MAITWNTFFFSGLFLTVYLIRTHMYRRDGLSDWEGGGGCCNDDGANTPPYTLDGLGIYTSSGCGRIMSLDVHPTCYDLSLYRLLLKKKKREQGCSNPSNVQKLSTPSSFTYRSSPQGSGWIVFFFIIIQDDFHPPPIFVCVLKFSIKVYR